VNNFGLYAFFLSSFGNFDLFDKECARILMNAHSSVPDNKLRVVHKEYMLEQFGGVACHPPAASLIEGLKSGMPHHLEGRNKISIRVWGVSGVNVTTNRDSVAVFWIPF
jgi:hypothetical protein